MTETDGQRASHAFLNVAHRRRKAVKIARIVDRRRPLNGLDVLEIGTGSGVISNYFGERVGANGRVASVDVVDERVLSDGYTFQQVEGVALPFADNSFDLVITNHVIEHVGNLDQQLEHLRELTRVLRPTGLSYLAVPNRWALREPHFGLWFLSWLPRWMSDRYVRLSGKGRFYDCRPPGPLRIRGLMRKAGLRYEDASHSAVRLVADIEGRGGAMKLVARLPDSILRLLAPAYPTMVFVLEDGSRALS